jgi:3-oxoacyl-[acyl-carrier-protein] synthase-1
MAAMAIEECAGAMPSPVRDHIPLLLCVSSDERPGRLSGVDDSLFARIEAILEWQFADESTVLAHGRAGVVAALLRARQLIYDEDIPYVLIAATDSLISWPTLSRFERDDRLLTSLNSNGFMPGEAGAAILVGRASGSAKLVCTGLSIETEDTRLGSGKPIRADGLTNAIRRAIAEADCQLHDVDVRIADLSGEQYFFKEASLALNRVLRTQKDSFELWHPAQSTGECGAPLGLICLAVGCAALEKQYEPGPRMIFHFSDAKWRAAVIGVGA